MAQQSSPHEPAGQESIHASVSGEVRDATGKPVSGASVVLDSRDVGDARRTDSLKTDSRSALTDASGHFAFRNLATGRYAVHAEGLRSRSDAADVVLANGASQRISLILGSAKDGAAKVSAGSGTSHQAIEFSDQPNFTVAGVTDWTAAGGHGSDATLRTSEDLVQRTSTLKAEPAGLAASGKPVLDRRDDEAAARLRAALAASPKSYAANRDLGRYYLHAARFQQAIPLLQSASELNGATADDEYDLALACRGVGDSARARRHIQRALAQEDRADFHRVAGELDESLGDPLAAVQQAERATQLDPSEENYFAWGSELLLHRAVREAAEVFQNGASSHPKSARLRTAWGTALFAGGLYDEAAQRLCEASDLNPADPEIYGFMGKVALASPSPRPCLVEKLARFVQSQPNNGRANYLYAMAMYKSDRAPDLKRVETLLTKAITLDPTCSEAYLQLGILSSARQSYPEAIRFYTKAVEADPQQVEAHYRLGLAYSHVGEADKARRELELRNEIEKAQAEAVEQQRRQIKQFVVAPQVQPRPAVNP